MTHLTRTRRRPTAVPAQVFALTLLALMSGASPPARGALVPLSFEELTHKSKYVLTGQVVRLASYRETVENLGNVIFTDVTIQVKSRILGALRDKEITLKVPGGVVGKLRQVCVEAAQFDEGELVLVFVSEVKGRLTVTGWKQGKYRLSPDGEFVLGEDDLPIGRRAPLSTIRSQVDLFAATKAPAASSTENGASAGEDR